ncbi:MAG: response regulator [Limnohabitans sp.]|nr:response regulator [Limnohabitans sp.]
MPSSTSLLIKACYFKRFITGSAWQTKHLDTMNKFAFNLALSKRLEKILAALPAHYQDRQVAFTFAYSFLIMTTVSNSSLFEPYAYGFEINLAYVFCILLGLIYLHFNGSLRIYIHLVTFLGMAKILINAWTSNGIFAPTCAWLIILPIPPFFVLSRRESYIWTCISVVLFFIMAFLTWHGYLYSDFQYGLEFMAIAFSDYCFLALALMSLPIVYDQLNKFTLIQSELRNIELEKCQKELQETTVSRDKFISAISHELRTPMNAILGFNNLLKDKVANNPRALQITQQTRQSAEHLLTVINDVLDYSQLQPGKLRINAENFQIRQTVENAFLLFKPKIESMRLAYSYDISDDVPQLIRGDKNRIMQILVNLIGNAVKFTHQGSVHIFVECSSTEILFSVRDTGIGIATEHFSSIFKRFNQADDKIQLRYGGSGLGLSICHNLVQLMGGEIGFESELGKGSRLWFKLPLISAISVDLLIASLPQENLIQNRTIHIMIVDDNAVNRLLLKKVLQSFCHHCSLYEADNGQKSLDILKNNPIDIIVMDMVMPIMDGIEATRRIRQDFWEPKCSIPILGLTANINALDGNIFMKAGANDIMFKPFEKVIMIEKMQRLMSDHAQSTSLPQPTKF